MQLTRFTDLALRSMMLVAAAERDGKRITTSTIATAGDASVHHVAKSVTALATHGFLETQRGRTGGLLLTDAGRSTSVGRIVRVLEADRDVVRCVGERQCPLLPACRLRRVLADAKEAFYRELEAYTVVDLTDHAVLPLVSLLPTPSRG